MNPNSTYRPDIDELRAVVLHHLARGVSLYHRDWSHRSVAGAMAREANLSRVEFVPGQPSEQGLNFVIPAVIRNHE